MLSKKWWRYGLKPRKLFTDKWTLIGNREKAKGRVVHAMSSLSNCVDGRTE